MKRFVLFFLLVSPLLLTAQLLYPAAKKGDIVDTYNLKKGLEITADIYSFIFYNMGIKPDFSNTNTPVVAPAKAF